MDVNVLGTIYRVEESDKEKDPQLDEYTDGFCDTSIKRCIIDNMKSVAEDPTSKKDLEAYKRQVKRHELIHAFLHESGLDANSWANNEEMVDWIAIQFPKLAAAFAEAECEK